MASLREHIELKEQPGFVDIPLNDQQSSRRNGLQISGWKFLPIIGVIFVMATLATLAILLPGHSKTDPSSPLQREMHSSPLSQPVGQFGIFQKMAQRIKEIEAKNEQKIKREEAAKAKQELDSDPVHPDFVKEEVSLENLKEHELGAPLPLKHPKQRRNEIPTHPDFEQVEVKLEMNAEHDAPDPAQKVIESSASDKSQTTPPNSPKELQKVLTPLKEEEKEEGERKVGTRESQKDVKQPKESTRLPTKRLENGRRVCQTPQCFEAAEWISESLDWSANPCNDFYQFACGGWIDKNPIPEETGQTGTFLEADSNLKEILKKILDAEEEHDAPEPIHMTHTFYETCMDTDTMDDLGLSPLVMALDGQGGWPMVLDDWDASTFSLTTALSNVQTLNVYPLVGVGVDLDLTNTSRRIIYIDAGQVPLGLTLMANPSAFILEAYAIFMSEAAKQLRDHLGSSVTDQEIDIQVKEVIDFEFLFTQTVLAAANETTDSMWYTDVSGVQADTDAGVPGQFNWLEFLWELFTDTGVTITEEEPVISFKGTFFGEFSKLVAATDPRILANAVGWWWLYELQEETTSAMRNASFHFQQSINGREEPFPRGSKCTVLSNANLGFALSREYVDQFMDPTAKPETTELVEHLRTAFNSLLDNNTWMLPEDLVVAREKLQAIDPFVAYPDWIMDDTQLTMGYEGLEIHHEKHVENLENIGAWFKLYSLASLRETPEHLFLFPPTIVNAFYNPQQNTITILAGILQPPFYSHNSLAALNYGGIGMIMGHEMTHGFDNTGRLFDKNGNMVQWWSNATIAAYTDHAQCFIDQYNSFIPPELSEVGLNISINGIQTEGENIADNGGIREAYRAYQLYVDHYGEEARLPGLDELSPDQLFYIGFANGWCEHKNAQATLLQLAIDAHSPGRYRVLGSLSNDEEFSRVWNCPANSTMNRGEDRCLLW